MRFNTLSSFLLMALVSMPAMAATRAKPVSDFPRQPNFGGELMTGVGSSATLAVAYGKDQSGHITTDELGTVRPVKVNVEYRDVQGYFGGAKKIQVWSGLKIEQDESTFVTGRDPKAGVTSLTRSKKDGVYRGTIKSQLQLNEYGGDGTVSGSSGEQLAAIQVAFNGGGKWDSNYARNYQLDLPRTQMTNDGNNPMTDMNGQNFFAQSQPLK